jgi:hypothetical protein
VHVNTTVPAGATVPMDWVAVGDPAQILPPNEHEPPARLQIGRRSDRSGPGGARAIRDGVVDTWTASVEQLADGPR